MTDQTTIEGRDDVRERDYLRADYILRDGEDFLRDVVPVRCLAAYEKHIETIRRVAREHGYAIGVHGSLRRDIDLIAVPWVDGASDGETLAGAIAGAVGGIIDMGAVPGRGTADDHRKPEPKPHGRLCWSIHLGGGPYLDLSVIPLQSTLDRTEASRRELVEERDAERFQRTECEKVLERCVAITPHATVDGIIVAIQRLIEERDQLRAELGRLEEAVIVEKERTIGLKRALSSAEERVNALEAENAAFRGALAAEAERITAMVRSEFDGLRKTVKKEFAALTEKEKA